MRLRDTVMMLKWELEKERKKVKVFHPSYAGNGRQNQGTRNGKSWIQETT